VGRIGVEGSETGVSVGRAFGLLLLCFEVDGAIKDARRRTVRWWASVDRAFNVRKKRYCTMMGARERNVVSIYGDFSIRAQVRYTSNRRRRTPRRTIERYSRGFSQCCTILARRSYIEIVLISLEAVEQEMAVDLQSQSASQNKIISSHLWLDQN
jgi:hypothetical protein